MYWALRGYIESKEEEILQSMQEAEATEISEDIESHIIFLRKAQEKAGNLFDKLGLTCYGSRNFYQQQQKRET